MDCDYEAGLDLDIDSEFGLLGNDRSATINIPNEGELFVFAFERDNKTAESLDSLNKLHQIFIKCQGYFCHPEIKFAPVGGQLGHRTLRIGDMATGTSIWVLELANAWPTFSYDAFDISPDHFRLGSMSLIEDHPKNMKFHTHEILKPLKMEFIGVFDIIHVRLLATALANDEWEKVVKNLMQGLKPGGWLQWDDADLSPTGLKAFETNPTNDGWVAAEKSSMALGVQTVNKWADLLGKDLSMSNQLPSIFKACGLVDVHHDQILTDKHVNLRKSFTIQMSSYFSATFLEYAKLDGSDMSVEQAEDLPGAMIYEAEEDKGYLSMNINVILGRKRKLSGKD